MFHVLTIESIEILNTAGDGQIFGEIMLEFLSHGLQTIYRRTMANPETKFAGDFLTLTAPSCEYESDSWVLYVSLYDGDDQHDIAVDEIDGFIHTHPLDEHISRTLTGKYGAVLVRYNALEDPVLSKIAVVLLGEKNGAARVFGTIIARQYLDEEEELPTSVILFRKSAGESVPVLSGGAIPMDRCVVGLPERSHITIEVELQRTGSGIESGDELIASGSVDFKHDDGKSDGDGKSDVTNMIISGSCGRQIQVSVQFGYYF